LKGGDDLSPSPLSPATLEVFSKGSTHDSMAASAGSCAHCGRQGVALKRCMRCKEVSYCGAECQKAGWKGHKKTCEPRKTVEEVWHEVRACHFPGDWRGVLKWEGRMEELLAEGTDANNDFTLHAFSRAHQMGLKSTKGSVHAGRAIRLLEMRVELLVKMERFRDQGEALCAVADILLALDKMKEAATTYTRARDVGAAHGFFSVESDACLGLGTIAMNDGRPEEGLDLLRNAVAAAPLSEADEGAYSVNALRMLIDALFATNAIDELEPLVPRFREAVQAQSRREGRFQPAEVRNFYISARLHEVPCIPSYCPAL